ncbi:MAG: hypothetical protein HY520_02115 [Candidatus Aenigmarchaeota archaeon]|nr:hypothetical protein [Candidatus Aenigmarchaeota archaeon]
MRKIIPFTLAAFLVLLSYGIIISEGQQVPVMLASWWSANGANIFNLNTGNVGIGTKNPGQQLEVNGAIRINTNKTKPACDEFSRGSLWVQKSEEEADTLEWCKQTKLLSLRTREDLPSPRRGLSCTESRVTGKTYCFGGSDGQLLSQIVEYDPSLNTMLTKSATLPAGIYHLSCAQSNVTGKIYCFGGSATGGPTNQIVEYDPATDIIMVKSATLPFERVNPSCVEGTVTGTIFCFGGDKTGANGVTQQIVEYNPLTDVVGVSPTTLPNPAAALSCTEARSGSGAKKIYCFGGDTGTGALKTIVEFDPPTNSIRSMAATLPTPRRAHSCATEAAANKIHCLGGDNSGLFDEITEYDPIADTMIVIRQVLPSPRDALSCAETAATHLIYCFGGYNGSSYLSQTVELGTETAATFEWIEVA